MPKIWQEKVIKTWAKKSRHGFGNANCKVLANFGNQPNGSQNFGFLKFW
jgi:hypothetical protein